MTHFIFGISSLLLLAEISVISSQRCPVHWSSYGNKCYRYFSLSQMSWSLAEESCQSQHGDMLKIESPGEMNYILHQLEHLQQGANVRANWWTGLINRGTSNTWLWSDNTIPANGSIPWADGRPSNITAGQGGRCAGIVNLKFQDEACTTSNQFICQRAKGVPLACNTDRKWEHFNNVCYKIGNLASWGNAHKNCDHMGGQLTPIDSIVDEVVVTHLALENKHPTWIGLHSTPDDTGNGTSPIWSWANGSLIGNLTYWKTPPIIPSIELNNTCVFVSNSAVNVHAWDTDSCDLLKHYICRKPQGVCQVGWIPHQTHCFKVNTQYPMSWPQARDYCKAQGGYLLIIRSGSNAAFINSFLNGLSKDAVDSLWLGASDNNKDNGSFVWSTGQQIGRYKNWASNTTNTPGLQDCVFISTSDRRGHWQITYNCLLPRAFICMANMGATIKAVATPAPQGMCPVDWQRFHELCYKFNNQRKTWLDARTSCQNEGGDLASIRDRDVQTFIMAKANKRRMWIGLNDRHREGEWTWLDDPNPPQFTYWHPTEPNNMHGTENCVQLWSNDGLWNDQKCSTKFPFICEKFSTKINVTVPPTVPKSWSAKCGAFWEESPINDYCYQFNNEMLDWDDAHSTCISAGGDLLSIETIQESAYITGRILSMATHAWIGANDRSIESGWKWSDGKPFAFLNWRAGEPNSYKNTEEDCGMIFKNTGKWNDARCGSAGNLRYGYICKKTGLVTTSVAPSTPSTTLPAGMMFGCLHGWKAYRGNCYRFMAQSVTWQGARTHCGRFGGELATVNSRQLQEFLFSQINNTSVHDNKLGYWIGLNDIQIQQTFQWVDGSKVRYTNWGAGEPNSYMGKQEDCVEIRVSEGGGWNDQVCSDQQLGYICQKSEQLLSQTQAPHIGSCFNISQSAMSYKYGDYCYTIQMGRRTWKSAQQYCSSQYGGYLATVNDMSTQSFLSSFLKMNTGYYFIGLSDASVSGTYIWADAQPFRYDAWYNTHTGNERSTCVAMRTTPPIGLWENKLCNRTNRFICQSRPPGYTPPTTTIRPTTTQEVPCPSGWSKYRGYCYNSFINSRFSSTRVMFSWMDSRSFCQSVGGDLVSFRDDAEAQFVITLFNGIYPRVDSFWIGLNNLDSERSFEWSDGTPLGYTNWELNEPNNYNQAENCALFNWNSKAWVDINCYMVDNFVCKLKLVEMCVGNDTEWFYNNGSCYYISKDGYSSDDQLSWYDARDFCLSNGGDLASFHTLEESGFIISQISRYSRTHFWIGLNELEQTGYSWSDGTVVNMIHWSINEPNDGYGAQRCVNMYQYNGFWNDDNCAEKFGYICKKENGSMTSVTVPPTPLTGGGCAHNFSPMPHSNKCYLLAGMGDETKLNWSSSVDYCRKFGKYYDIASINSEYQQAFLVTMMLNQHESFWIGLNSRAYANQFEWQDNSRFQFDNWNTGMPITAYPRKNCVKMQSHQLKAGKWSNHYCADVNAFICQGRKDISEPTLVPSTSCPTGYTHYGTSCYSLMTNLQLNWQDALQDCQSSPNGNLVSITSAYEQAFVEILTQNKAIWIGLSDFQSKGTYGWSDGWPVQYTNWHSEEPSYSDGEGCVMMETGLWSDTQCAQELSYVCEISTVPPPVTTPIPPGYCADRSWIALGKYCYFIDTYNFKSWPGANFFCQKLGMELASIESVEETRALVSVIETQFTTTTTYTYRYNSRPPYNTDNTANVYGLDTLWIGLTKNAGGDYMWSDNSPVGFTHWRHGEPTNVWAGKKEECIEIMKTTGEWNDEDCFKSQGYICKTPKIIPSSSISTNSQPSKAVATTITAAPPTINKKSTTTTMPTPTPTTAVRPTTGIPCVDTVPTCDDPMLENPCSFSNRAWAQQHCARHCGLCTVQVRPSQCEDLLMNCEDYGPMVCAKYPSWAYTHCTRYCNLCSGIGTTPKLPCKDNIPDCGYYGKSRCVGVFQKWAEDNCAQYCDYCSSFLPPTENPPGTCRDNVPVCSEYGRDICTYFSLWARSNCASYCGFCGTSTSSKRITETLVPRITTKAPTAAAIKSTTTKQMKQTTSAPPNPPVTTPKRLSNPTPASPSPSLSPRSSPSPSPSPSPTQQKPFTQKQTGSVRSDGSLSGGAIAGIAVGAVLFVCLVVIVAVVIIRGKQGHMRSPLGFENALYAPSGDLSENETNIDIKNPKMSHYESVDIKSTDA
ncbi:hypothetical protein ScPMuIL_013159 [Solemya velum]